MIPQEIKDKIEAYVKNRFDYLRDAPITYEVTTGKMIANMSDGYSLALPTITEQAERIKQLEEALREIANESWFPQLATPAMAITHFKSIATAALHPSKTK